MDRTIGSALCNSILRGRKAVRRLIVHGQCGGTNKGTPAQHIDPWRPQSTQAIPVLLLPYDVILCHLFRVRTRLHHLLVLSPTTLRRRRQPCLSKTA